MQITAFKSTKIGSLEDIWAILGGGERDGGACKLMYYCIQS